MSAAREKDMRVGQVWIDKDRRMSGRRVRVVETDEHFTRYVPAHRDKPKYESRTPRFVKAFRPETLQERQESRP